MAGFKSTEEKAKNYFEKYRKACNTLVLNNFVLFKQNSPWIYKIPYSFTPSLDPGPHTVCKYRNWEIVWSHATSSTGALTKLCVNCLALCTTGIIVLTRPF